MSDLFLLSGAQMRRIEPYFSLSSGIARGDGRPLVMLLSEGQMRGFKGAALMLSDQSSYYYVDRNMPAIQPSINSSRRATSRER